jgi:cobalt-zinc-cadmium efflux system protein
MSHDHELEQGGADRIGRAFVIGTALNIVFVVVESIFGVLAHSSALLADAAHNFSDVLGLAMAWGATALARRSPSNRHTYGLRRATVLAALSNALLLLTAVGAVAWEAIGRLRMPSDVKSSTMMLVAAVGVVVNAASALLFLKARKQDANVRGAFLHLAADAAVSAGVVVAAAVLWRTGWRWLDPVTSLIVSAVVLLGTWGLLRDALHLVLDGVPKGVELESVRSFLEALPGVQAVHDLHVWAMSTTEFALTAHIVTEWGDSPPVFLAGLEHELSNRFGIAHTTVQIDPAGDEACARGTLGVV